MVYYNNDKNKSEEVLKQLYRLLSDVYLENLNVNNIDIIENKEKNNEEKYNLFEDK